MKSRHWIVPSLAAVLGGIGYGVAQNMPAGDVGNSAAPKSAQSAADVTTAGASGTSSAATSDRVSLSYRRKGDQNFAEVKVATVEPFKGSVSIDSRMAATVSENAAPSGAEEPSVAGESALAPTSVPHRSQAGAAAFLKNVAAAGDAAAASLKKGVTRVDAAEATPAPAFETTKLSSRLADSDQPEWQSRFFADNPLVGGIFQGDGSRSDAAALLGAAKSARYVLLGESHDNPDHHLLQSDIVNDLAAHSSPAAPDMSMVFEMIPHRLGDAVSAFGTDRSKSIDLDTLGDRLQWAQRGWPEFSMYRPLFSAAQDHGLAVSAGDLDRDVVSSIAQNGISSLSPQERTRLSLDGDADPAMIADLMDEVRTAHCGLMPAGAIAPMADVQRARDGALAAAMEKAAKNGDKSVLIAGAGHVRNDRGVPSILKRNDPEAGTLSVRMLEVAGDDGVVSDYGLKADAPAPFDFTIFTPRASTEDPCEGLRAKMQAKDGASAQ